MEEKEVKLTNTSDSISSKSTITGACEGTGGVATCPISTAVISCLIQTLIDIYQFIEIHISVLLFLFFFGFLVSFFHWLEGETQTSAIHSIPKKSIETAAGKGSRGVWTGGINVAVISSAFSITLVAIYSIKTKRNGKQLEDAKGAHNDSLKGRKYQCSFDQTFDTQCCSCKDMTQWCWHMMNVQSMWILRTVLHTRCNLK